MDKRPPGYNSIDGFSLRRRTPSNGNGSGAGRPLGADNLAVPERFLRPGVDQGPSANSRSAHGELPRPVIAPRAATVAVPQRDPAVTGIRRSEIDESLRSIDETPDKHKRFKKARPGRKKLVKRIILVILVLLLALGLFMGIKAFIASSRVFNGNIFDLLGQEQPLKTDKYGRSNILVFGTSEDDPGHEAGELTDSIMIISLDQKNKNAGMVSVPRDLWVKYGDACTAGFEGKINAVYECYSDNGTNQEAGADALKENVGEQFGIDIQYYAQVNYTVVRQVVDSVGGITVNIDSDDPRGILDRNFDWKCGYRCYYVKWPNGPAKLDGEHALALARARNASGGYGLGGGNFDREQYQQKIITALKERATSAGTLANPVAVTGLIDALGDNVRTNFSGGEIKTLIGLAKDIPSDKIKSISLVDQGSAVVTTGNIRGQSVVRPVAGIYDFSDVQSYVRQKLSALGGVNGEESADIVILNGSTSVGVGGAKSKELQAAGISISSVGDTDANNYPEISWYDLSGGKAPKTAAKLKMELGVASSGATLPSGVRSDADFVIIVGDGAN